MHSPVSLAVQLKARTYPRNAEKLYVHLGADEKRLKLSLMLSASE
jgi:hypothetical protein